MNIPKIPQMFSSFETYLPHSQSFCWCSNCNFHAEAIMIDVCIGLYSMIIYIYIHTYIPKLGCWNPQFSCLWYKKKHVVSSSIFWTSETKRCKKKTPKTQWFLMLKIPIVFLSCRSPARTMIYDEAFEVKVDGLSFLAFSRFEPLG